MIFLTFTNLTTIFYPTFKSRKKIISNKYRKNITSNTNSIFFSFIQQNKSTSLNHQNLNDPTHKIHEKICIFFPFTRHILSSVIVNNILSIPYGYIYWVWCTLSTAVSMAFNSILVFYLYTNIIYTAIHTLVDVHRKILKLILYNRLIVE